MTPQIATFLCVALIIGLFVLDHDRGPRPSKAFWILFVYLLLDGSRPLSFWLGMAPQAGTDTYMNGSPIDRTIDLILLGAVTAVLIARSERVRRVLSENKPLLLLLAYSALTVLWSDYGFVTFKHWVKDAGSAVIALAILTDPEPLAAIKRLLTWAGFILLPLSLLLAKYYPQTGRVYSPGWALEYTGVTMNKNTLGVVCLIFGLASVWCWLGAYQDRGNPYRRRRLLAHGILIGLAVWLLSMCDSMTSICCLAMASIVLIWSMRPSFRLGRMKVHLLVAALVGVSFFALFVNRNMVTLVGRNATLTGRTDIWASVLKVPHNPLLGVGYESFFLGWRLQKFWSLGNYPLQEAHNGYLEIYLNLGWIGVGFFSLLLLDGYHKIIAAFRRHWEAYSFNLAIFVAVVIHSFTEAGFRMETLSWILLLWAIMGASEAACPESLPMADADRSDETAEPEPHWAAPWIPEAQQPQAFPCEEKAQVGPGSLKSDVSNGR